MDVRHAQVCMYVMYNVCTVRRLSKIEVEEDRTKADARLGNGCSTAVVRGPGKRGGPWRLYWRGACERADGW
jgi:hypothetical protein